MRHRVPLSIRVLMQGTQIWQLKARQSALEKDPRYKMGLNTLI